MMASRSSSGSSMSLSGHQYESEHSDKQENANQAEHLAENCAQTNWNVDSPGRAFVSHFGPHRPCKILEIHKFAVRDEESLPSHLQWVRGFGFNVLRAEWVEFAPNTSPRLRAFFEVKVGLVNFWSDFESGSWRS